jgi:DNA-binding MarR family transcriptional regulator
MLRKPEPGLGELLRYVSELVDQGAEEHYRARSLSHRPRFTPVLRAIAAGARTVSDITELTHITQGAVSQSVALLVADGQLARQPMEDARKSGIRLTPKGRAHLKKLQPHWNVTFAAIAGLEAEIGFPLRDALAAAAAALERSSFAARLAAAAASPDLNPEKSDAQ